MTELINTFLLNLCKTSSALKKQLCTKKLVKNAVSEIKSSIKNLDNENSAMNTKQNLQILNELSTHKKNQKIIENQGAGLEFSQSLLKKLLSSEELDEAASDQIATKFSVVNFKRINRTAQYKEDRNQSSLRVKKMRKKNDLLDIAKNATTF